MARNLRINSESANDPCSAQSWTLGHPRNRWGRLVLRDLVIRPQPACTNEATPYGESPEAIRPDTNGHTAETPEATRPDTQGQTGGFPYDVTVVGMCCVEGLMTSIPGEEVVAQPRGPNRARGIQRGDHIDNIQSSLCLRTCCRQTKWGEMGPSPSAEPVTQPHGRLATERRPAAPKCSQNIQLPSVILHTTKMRRNIQLPSVILRTFCCRYVPAHFVFSRFPQDSE